MGYNFIEGEILLIDKPHGWTSFDVVAKVRNQIRRLVGQRVKVGHAGTLDPMATGLLILATGKKTKMINQLQGLDKEYIATILLGATTPSYDAETPVMQTYPTDHITAELVEEKAKSFLGKQLQIPPKYSAKKIKGKKAYDLARQGKDFQMKAIQVEYKEIEILSLSLPHEIIIRLVVSKGTYIRSFAHDLGQKLGSGAYLAGLRRTRIGSYSVEEAMSIEQFIDSLKTKKN